MVRKQVNRTFRKISEIFERNKEIPYNTLSCLWEREGQSNKIKLTQLAAQQVPPLTPEQFLRREYATSTDQGIASEYGIARSSVFQLRRSFGIPTHTRKELFELNPAEKQEAIREHGIAVGKANNRISFPNGEPVKDGIERRLREGATWEQIAQDAGITVNGIKSRAQRLGISRRSR